MVNGGRDRDKPTILVSPQAPDARKAPQFDDPKGSSSSARPSLRATPTAPAAQLPFKLPHAPGEGDSQALATNTKDGGIVYDVAYSLVTVSGGEPVDNENSAYALASCKACTTLAVSFQLVLVVGQSDRITPINVAEALNLKCPSCITTAIAKQIVISVRSAPSAELLKRLTEELKKLDAIDLDDSPADVLAKVNAVSDAINKALDDSGITYPKATATPEATSTPDATETPDATATPDATETPDAAPTTTPAPSGDRDTDPDPNGHADRHSDAGGHHGRDALALAPGRGESCRGTALALTRSARCYWRSCASVRAVEGTNCFGPETRVRRRQPGHGYLQRARGMCAADDQRGRAARSRLRPAGDMVARGVGPRARRRRPSTLGVAARSCAVGERTDRDRPLARV